MSTSTLPVAIVTEVASLNRLALHQVAQEGRLHARLTTCRYRPSSSITDIDSRAHTSARRCLAVRETRPHAGLASVSSPPQRGCPPSHIPARPLPRGRHNPPSPLAKGRRMTTKNCPGVTHLSIRPTSRSSADNSPLPDKSRPRSGCWCCPLGRRGTPSSSQTCIHPSPGKARRQAVHSRDVRPWPWLALTGEG